MFENHPSYPVVFRILVLVLLCGSPAFAQAGDEPGELPSIVKPGTTVWITESTGKETKTRVVDLTGDVLTVSAAGRERRIATADVQRVRVRHSDPLLNGALIGAASAIVPSLMFCVAIESWEVCRDDVGPITTIGSIGAGIGIGIDALVRGRKTVYEAGRRSMRVYAAPLAARGAAGLQVSFSF